MQLLQQSYFANVQTLAMGKLLIFPCECLVVLLWLVSCTTTPAVIEDNGLPSGFEELKVVIPDLLLDVRYASSDNFVGQAIEGYLAPKVYLTRSAALALKEVQAELVEFGLGLKVFDGYRPQQAVDHFVRWAEDPGSTRMKSSYYPNVLKSALFAEGYIAQRSGHSRGSSIDLTVVARQNNSFTELDMGTTWDYFDPLSWSMAAQISPLQRANRLLLRSLMIRHGFVPLAEEWWHFTFSDEPYPETYFAFPIE